MCSCASALTAPVPPVGQLRIAAHNRERCFQFMRHLVQKFAFQPVELGQHLALTAALGQLLFPAVDLQTDGSRDQEYEHQQIMAVPLRGA